MTKQLRGVLLLATITLIATCATTFAGGVKVTPVKGASYAGVVHNETITVKVAKNGKTASVSLRSAPAFCQGGSGPELPRSKPGAISKKGSLSVTISYSSPQTHKTFASVLVKGNFYTFTGSAPVFQGTVKSSFSSAGAKECDGQESFEATKL